MTLKALPIVMVACGVSAAAPPAVAKRTRYLAPDRQVRAVVVHHKPVSYGGGEDAVEIRDARGRLLARQDYSDGGTQGYAVEKAAWTADSSFFVFSLESAGGHQPWRHDPHFYDRRTGRFADLDALGAPGIDTLFRLSPPAKVTLHSSATGRMTVDLRRLSKRQLQKAWAGEKQLQEALKRER